MNLVREDVDLKALLELHDYYYNKLLKLPRRSEEWFKTVLLYELIADDINTLRNNKRKQFT